MKMTLIKGILDYTTEVTSSSAPNSPSVAPIFDNCKLSPYATYRNSSIPNDTICVPSSSRTSYNNNMSIEMYYYFNNNWYTFTAKKSDLEAARKQVEKNNHDIDDQIKTQGRLALQLEDYIGKFKDQFKNDLNITTDDLTLSNLSDWIDSYRKNQDPELIKNNTKKFMSYF